MAYETEVTEIFIMKRKIIIWRLITGIILISLAGYFIYNAIFIMPVYDREWIDSSVKTTGSVIELHETFRNKSYCDYVEIRYITQDNRTLTFRPYDCYSKGTFSKGQAVSIRYSKSNPETALLDKGDTDRGTQTAVILLGIFMLVCGVIFIAVAVKKE